MKLDQVHQHLREWCAGRSPWGRLIVLAWMGYIGVRHLTDPDYVSLFFWLNAPIHEAGHFIMGLFRWEFLAVAAGTLFQLGAPLAAAMNFVRQGDWFAQCVCGVWLGTNFHGIAAYMADARSMALPLFRPFGMDPDIHDWHYMLSKFGLLRWDTTLAWGVNALGAVTIWASLAAGGYMIYLMLRPQGQTHGNSSK